MDRDLVKARDVVDLQITGRPEVSPERRVVGTYSLGPRAVETDINHHHGKDCNGKRIHSSVRDTEDRRKGIVERHRREDTRNR